MGRWIATLLIMIVSASVSAMIIKIALVAFRAGDSGVTGAMVFLFAWISFLTVLVRLP